MKLNLSTNHLVLKNKSEEIIKLCTTKNSDFDSTIQNIENFLNDVKEFFDEKLNKLIEKTSTIDKEFILNNFSPLINHLSFLIEQLSQYLNSISKDQFLLYQKLTKEKLDKFFMLAPFPSRAFTKPLGFAGDYKMMYMIQELQDDGDDLFSKFINVYYTNTPISNSVKNRTKTLVKYLEQTISKAESLNKNKSQILSVGCGPALEVRNYLRKNNPKIECEFNLLDFNKETLEFAKNQSLIFAKEKNCQINLIEKSVYNLTSYSNFAKVVDGKFDFIYCSGLFDYLSDNLCKKLVGIFYHSLNKGGRLLVTNMVSEKIGKTMMELTLDWHLIYRAETDMISIANKLGKFKTFTDSTKANLCLEIVKT